jgi:hypothetical protein
MLITIASTICGVGQLKMLNLKKTSASLNRNPNWGTAISLEHVPTPGDMLYFDQNGYDLTRLEQLYADANYTDVSKVRWRTAIRTDWFTSNSISAAHINHASLFERKGYTGAALEQITEFAKTVPLIYKLAHLRPKWGIDMSIDYVDEEKAFEVFHYEWDDFDCDSVIAKQQEIENIVLNIDWDDAAHAIWQRRDDWISLDFSGQSKYKTDFFGLPPERFKLVAWD